MERDLDDPWCRERREQTALGKRFERVRIVDGPPTEGQRSLLDTDGKPGPSGPNGYSPQARAGDPDALICRRDNAPPPEDPTSPAFSVCLWYADVSPMQHRTPHSSGRRGDLRRSGARKIGPALLWQ